MGLSVKCPSRGRATAAGTPTNARQIDGISTSHSWSPDPPHKYLVFNRSSAGFYRANIAGKENVDPPALQNPRKRASKGRPTACVIRSGTAMWQRPSASGFLAICACLTTCAAAMAQPLPPVILKSSRPDARGMLRLTVRNDSDKDIVAYVYSTTYQSGGKTVHDSIFQDECLLDTFEGMTPGGEVTDLRGGPGISGLGFQIRAVVFADGSVSGDADWVPRVLRRRQYAEKEYRNTARELAGLTGTAQLGTLLDALGKSFAARLAKSTDPDEKEWVSRVHRFAVQILDRRFPDSKMTSDGIQELVSTLESAADKAAGKQL